MKIDQLTPTPVVLKELGKRLSRIRKQQGYSQDKLANEAGIGVATLRRIEDGNDSQFGSWLKLLKALNLTSSLENILPESFHSPLAEVKAQQKPRRAKNKQIVVEKPEEPVSSSQSVKKIIWGDEKP